ncbi:MAG: GHMP kinase [Anaerolineae bacterium]
MIPGTCGEWVQGTWEGVPCLVSCSVGLWVRVVTYLSGQSHPWKLRASRPKATRALALALRARGYAGWGALMIDNPLPMARGYASSTADVAGTIYAVGRALGEPFSAGEVARLAVQVEPTDSSLFPQLTLFAHRTAEIIRPLGDPPPASVVIVDPGGEVDTLAFNRADHGAVMRSLVPRHRDAFQMLMDGVRLGDLPLMARAATESALAHQAVLPNPLVTAAAALARCWGALGICRAHSGTIVGLICHPEAAEHVVRRAGAHFRGCGVTHVRCVPGAPAAQVT